MTTKQSCDPKNEFPNSGLCEYKLAVITRSDLQETYGIAAWDEDDPRELYIKEIGADQALVQSMVNTLNRYRVPYVHVFDVISDLMNEQ